MTSKLRCLLLDDELLGLQYLKMLCEKIPGLEVVKAFDNPLHFLEEEAALNYDFVFLDIEMPQMNGLDLAHKIPHKKFVFLTAYKQFALDAFDLDAVDYLTKPVKQERLQQAVDKIRLHLFPEIKHVTRLHLQADRGKVFLDIDRILYLAVSELDSRDKLLVYADLSSLTLKNITLPNLLELLPDHLFCRINKQVLVALQYVGEFSSTEVQMNKINKDGKAIKFALSELYRKDFIRMIGR